MTDLEENWLWIIAVPALQQSQGKSHGAWTLFDKNKK